VFIIDSREDVVTTLEGEGQVRVKQAVSLPWACLSGREGRAVGMFQGCFEKIAA